jgi:hypothetical protein
MRLIEESIVRYQKKYGVRAPAPESSAPVMAAPTDPTTPPAMIPVSVVGR